jgi:hypothetical protein
MGFFLLDQVANISTPFLAECAAPEYPVVWVKNKSYQKRSNVIHFPYNRLVKNALEFHPRHRCA